MYSDMYIQYSDVTFIIDVIKVCVFVLMCCMPKVKVFVDFHLLGQTCVVYGRFKGWEFAGLYSWYQSSG